MAGYLRIKVAFWCALVIATSIILGHYTGPGGYIVPLVTGGMIINYLVRGRAVPLVEKFESLTVQFIVAFIAFTSLIMLISHLLGFIFLK